MNARRVLSTTAVATAAIALSIGVQTLAYSAPGAAPTGGDADAPLNTGLNTQIKAGAIKIGSGTFTPATGLGVFGAFKFADGSQGSGKILSSAAGGDATWKDPLDPAGLNLQKGVSSVNNPCTVGSSIIQISQSTGAITCGKKMQAGVEVGDSTTHTVTFAAMPDTSYAAIVQYEYGGTSNSSACFDPKIDKASKTTTSFTFKTGDTCNEPIYNWMVIDY